MFILSGCWCDEGDSMQNESSVKNHCHRAECCGVRNGKLQVLLSSNHALLRFIYSYISFSETNRRDEGKFKISGKTERFFFHVKNNPVIFRHLVDMWFIHRGLRPRWINYVSPRGLKITLTYISFSDDNDRDAGKFKNSATTERFRRKKG